ncbi:unnamed protein product, partial [Brenthis ino]
MADSTVSDVSKMKVVDLRKELKSRGLSYAGDKAELIARLQSAMSEDDHGDINLDSDEIDSDGVLEDEEDKSQNDILDDSAVDTLNEELALVENSPEKHIPESKPLRTLKRKITTETPKTENKETIAKKIVLNRSVSVSSITTKSSGDKKVIEAPDTDIPEKISSNNKIKISAEIDPKTRLEMRAKRFGLPVKMTEEQRKEARKQRFNQNTVSNNSNASITTAESGSLADNIDKLKLRAQRFGQSVSAIMTDIENKEKLEKRKAKFNANK